MAEILSNRIIAERRVYVEDPKKEGGSTDTKRPPLRTRAWEDAQTRLAYLLPHDDLFPLIQYYHSAHMWDSGLKSDPVWYYRKRLFPRYKRAVEMISESYPWDEMTQGIIETHREEMEERQAEPRPGTEGRQEGAERAVVETNSGREMSREKSEGNLAVLAVVIAGVLTTTVEPGAYTWGATVIGLLFLLLLLAYDNRPDDESYGHSAAFAAAWAFSVLLLPGWLLNPVLFKPPYEPGSQPSHRWFNTFDIAYFVIWLLLGMGALWYRRRFTLAEPRHPLQRELRRWFDPQP